MGSLVYQEVVYSLKYVLQYHWTSARKLFKECDINTAKYSKKRLMMITKVTLNIDSSKYGKFKRYCKERGLVVSKTIELYMEKFIKGEEK